MRGRVESWNDGKFWASVANWAIFFWGGQWQETVVKGKMCF